MPVDSKHSIVVAVSGSGRSLANLLAWSEKAESCFEVVGVISSNAHCRGLAIAQEAGLRSFVGDFRQSEVEGTYAALKLWLAERQPRWIVLAGFLKPFPIMPGYEASILNIHPALLPRFGGPGMYGKRVHQAVVAEKEVVTGASVHLVTEVYDEGPVIAQVRIPVQTDDAEELAKQVFEAECDLLPRSIDMLARGELSCQPSDVYVYDFENKLP